MLATCLTEKNTYINQIDPRIRIITAVIFSVWLAAQQQIFVLFIGLFISFLFIKLAKISLATLFHRLLPLNLFIILIWLILPFSLSDKYPFISVDYIGLHWALLITLKANAIVISLTALVATLELITLGYALHQLYIPTKIIHLLLLTIRYLDILHQTYQQLRRAMQVRCFQAKTNWHTYRSIGYLLGMLLVKSFSRAQQIEIAMKCRGYTGQFYLLTHLHYQRRDKVFLAIFLLTITLLTILI